MLRHGFPLTYGSGLQPKRRGERRAVMTVDDAATLAARPFDLPLEITWARLRRLPVLQSVPASLL